MPIPAAIRFRTDSVVSLSKMIMGSKASFHKIAVCDLADGLGTAKADIIGIFLCLLNGWTPWIHRENGMHCQIQVFF